MLIVWDMPAFKMVGTPTKAHTSPLLHLTYSPDGQMLATGDDKGEISIWQMSPRPQLFKTLPYQTRRISTLAFSPNGQWLASGSYDSQVLLWDTTTFELVTRIPTADKSEVYSVTFSPDSSLLAVGNKSGAVTVYNMQPSFWLAQVCALTNGAAFIQNQWNQYFPGETYRSDTCQ